MVMWLEKSGRLMTEEEELAVDSRTRKAASARNPTKPRMVAPEDIASELLGAGALAAVRARLPNPSAHSPIPYPAGTVGSDEELMATALGAEFDNSEDVEGKKPGWTAVKPKRGRQPSKPAGKQLATSALAAAALSSDEALLEQALGGLDLSDDDELA